MCVCVRERERDKVRERGGWVGGRVRGGREETENVIERGRTERVCDRNGDSHIEREVEREKERDTKREREKERERNGC